MLKNSKIKASALQMTVFIAIVIALLLFSFIVLIHTHKKFGVDSNFVVETISNSDRGIHYALANKMILNDSIRIEDENYRDLVVHRNFWGVFEKITSTSTIKSKRFSKMALIGNKQPRTMRTALYLKDNKKPLVLVGNTKVQGLAYLPQRGAKTGNISGQSYYGSQLIYGTIKRSKSFPSLLSEAILNLTNIEKEFNVLESRQFLNLNTERKHQNSFFMTPRYIFSNTDILLSDVSLIGHIVVKSNTKIVVNASSNLKDIILVAPEIEINDNVLGTFQAIATNNIQVGKNCKLEYPSALVLKEGNTDKKRSSIINIGSKTEIDGIVLYIGKSIKKNNDAQVVIKKSAIVKGEIYCNQNLELLGSVYGSVFTSNFIANQAGSIYQNHIYNGTISIDKLPEQYIGLLFINGQKGVAKWLY